jgi:superfamily II DNA/RNA helicase
VDIENLTETIANAFNYKVGVGFSHGGMKEEKRSDVRTKFTKLDIQCLVANDVGARGLDVKVFFFF